ncbi:AMP-binding protein [Paraburkholderia xenovorans]|uniref:AMP-binding protein n=1 Tax=Paraburkholderia xenovorans TaxID=36873 RepID=UPI0038B81C54
MCDKWAALDPAQPALIHEHCNGHVTRVSFGELRRRSNQTANCLRRRGATQENRVAILLAQSPQTAFAHIAAFNAGAISLPLFALFGEEALEYRLRDSGASVLVTDTGGARKIAAIRQKLAALVTVLVTDSIRASRQLRVQKTLTTQLMQSPTRSSAGDQRG